MILHRLNQVQKNLNTVWGINWGGCGISALAMYRWLKENDMLIGDESFTYLYISSDDTFHTNSSVLNEKDNNCKLGSASHIMLYHNGKNHDSKGSDIDYRYVRSHTGISEEQLLESIRFGLWNDGFGRENWIPVMEQMLNVNLSDIKN